MNKLAVWVFFSGLLAFFGTAAANSCISLNPEVPASEVAGTLSGHGCFVGRADAHVDWHLEDVVGRNVIVSLDASAGTTLTLLSDAGEELATVEGEADWVLAPGQFRFRVDTVPGERYVVTARAGDWRTIVESRLRPADDRSRVRTEFSYTGLLADSPYYLTWDLREGDASTWEVLVTPGPGVPLNVKIFSPEGDLLHHLTGGPAESARLLPLELTPGNYTFVASEATWSGAAIRIDATPVGADAGDGVKTGRPSSFATANRITLGGVSGSLVEDSRDYYRLDLTADEAGIYDIAAGNEADMTFCLLDARNNELGCYSGVEIVAHNVALPAGSTYLSLAGSRANQDVYTVEFEEVADPAELEVVGPAGSLAGAHLMLDGTARLTLEARTITWLAFEVSDPGLYRLQLQGPDAMNVYVRDGGGAELRRFSPRSEQVVRIDNVPLREGLNYVTLDARAGDYALRVLRVGDLPQVHQAVPEAGATEEVSARPAGSIVPSVNISSGTAAELRPGQPYTATSLPGQESSYYRFSLQNEAMVRLTLTPPEDAVMRLYLQGTMLESREAGAAVVIDDWLPAGDYEALARSMNGTDGWYQLELEFLDPFDRTGGVYVPRQHAPLPVGSDLRIVLEQPRPAQTYHLLPELLEDTTLAVSYGDVSYNYLRLYTWPELDLLREDVREDGRQEFELSAGQYVLRLEAGVPWDVQLELSDGPGPVVSSLESDVEVELELTEDEVAAWSVWGQRLAGVIRVTNSGDDDLELEVLTHSTDPRVTLPLAGDSLSVAAGSNLELPVELTLPADIFSGSPLDFNYGLADGSGKSVSTRASVVPTCEAPLVGGHSWWPVPESVLGYLNVAWQPFGASLAADAAGSDMFVLDGRISPARPPTRNFGHEFLLDLGEARELTATALHPVGSGSGSERLRNFELAVSADGQDWTVILNDRLVPARVEQFFTFDEPVTARYARLTMLDSFGQRDAVGIGEWKLLSPASPGQLNIAAESLGGHVVHSKPLVPGSYSMLADPDFGGSPSHGAVAVRSGEELPEWVIGFHHNRAARVASVEWMDSAREQNVDNLKLWVATESPLGPWLELADWELERDAGHAVLQLDEPVWARFMRFQVQGESPERNTNYELPLQLKVIEAGDYPSILGEWGMDSSWSYYEYSNPELFTEASVVFGSNDSLESALLLEETETGYVQTGIAENWYRVVMPAERNLANVTIRSEPGVILGFELLDSDGNLVQSGLSDGGSMRLTGEPGTHWHLRVFEPPRSVLFTWDTSGSVSPYQNLTYAALERFASAIRGDLESVMLLAFGNEPNFLLPEWSSDAAEVSRTINAYDRRDDSSDARLNLLAASDSIADRDGVRAIVLITDAETPGYGLTADLWDSLADSGAQVYSLEISTAGGAPAQDLMQDWASANGGHYVNATSLTELEQGFARADCLIRRAKYVEVSVEFQEREAIPGTLSVVQPVEGGGAGGSTLAAGGGILVILDSSGSMYRTLDGRYRYEIAKDVLADLVTDVLPAEVPFALRVFGNREANVCRSDLEVALAPLSAQAVTGVIAGIEPQPFAGTPIAASLQAAAADLADASGHRSVILITDGEESCDGDVEAAITDLRSAGFDVTLNIIGFDFDADDVDAAREQFRSWAELGGGQYFDATSADELAGALQSSVALPYEVLDAEGNVVARGNVNGFALELEGGVYTVRVLAEEPLVFTDVVIDGDAVAGRVDQRQLFKIGSIGERDVLVADPKHRCIEMVETFLHADGNHFGRDRTLRPAFFGHHEPVGLGQAFEDCLAVQRTQRPQVDHFGVDALACQLLGGFQREANADGIGHDRHIAALAHDPRLADRQHMVVQLGDLEIAAIDQLVFEKHDRVLTADGSLEQALRIRRIVWSNDDQARNAGVPRPVVLAVLRPDAAGRAIGPAEDHRTAHLPARHVIGLGCGVDDMVDRLHGEVERHELDDRAQAAHRCAGPDAGKTVFGDRRIDDALGAEFFEQALRDFVGALIFRHFLAHHEDALVQTHFFGHGVAQGLANGQLDHIGTGRNVGIGFPGALLRRFYRFRRGRTLRFLRGRRLLLRLGSGARRCHLFTLASEHGNHRAHFHVFTAFGDQDLADSAFVDALEFHRRLVGLDLGQDVAGGYFIAFLDQPAGQCSLFHRRGKGRHLEFDCHQ